MKFMKARLMTGRHRQVAKAVAEAILKVVFVASPLIVVGLQVLHHWKGW